MTYFLDFDRTLFDTEALYAYLLDNALVPEPYATTLRDRFPGKADYSSEPWKLFNAALERGDFQYVPDHPERFLYPDTLDFLQKHGSLSTVVTVGLLNIQQAKVEATGVAALVADVVYAGFREKGEVLKERYPVALPDAFYVDDSLTQLDSVARHCPWLTLYEMRRDGKEGSGTYPVVHSLAGLPLVP